MQHPVVLLRGELKEKTYPERIGFLTAVSYHFYESSRQEGGTVFIFGPNNRQVQTPLDIVSEELSKRLIWGNELKMVVQIRFGFGARIGGMIEQLPHEENEITLDSRVRDDLGLPVPKSTCAKEGTVRVSSLSRQLFEALGTSKVQVRMGPAPGHFIGGCSMGDDPKSSVVDRNLRVHGVENLYIAGSTVFPTSGAVWPTLTIAALALRLGNFIGANLKRAKLPSNRSLRRIASHLWQFSSFVNRRF